MDLVFSRLTHSSLTPTMASLAIESCGLSHPSLWLGAYEADHPALSLHYKNTTTCTSVPHNSDNSAQKKSPAADGTIANGATTINDGSSTSDDGSSSEESHQSQQTTTTKPATGDDIQGSEEVTPEPATNINDEQPHPWYALFPTDVAAELVEKTEERVQEVMDNSTFLVDEPLEEKVPAFTLKTDLERGDLLGCGGFAMIYNATVKDPTRLPSTAWEDKENREYVIKHLSPSLLNQHRKLHIGTRDFVIESHLMATLDHPHILKLVGCSKGGLANYGKTLRTDALFMVLPKLTCTLTERMLSWKEECQARRRRPKLLGYPEKSKSFSWSKGAILARQRILREAEEHQKEADFFYYRIQVVIDLLSALEYLHAHRLFHRDIKPDNIGFDTAGHLKLFDLGLAKELPPDEEAANKDKSVFKENLTFQLPGNTGTARYMAPEVILKQPYNCKVDVFAASILCWEVISLERAYVNGVPSGQFFKDCVALYNDRPPVPRKWPKAIRKIVKQGWIKDISSRPTSGKMKLSLQKIVDEYRHNR